MTVARRVEFRFFHRLRVRWAEVDMQKIVFNGHYLMYLDTAFADYWRALALPYEATLHALGGDLYVRRASLDYHASARYEDILDVGLRCARIGNSSFTVAGAIFRGDDCLVEGELVYVFADPATQTSRPVPQALRDILTGFDAGEAMVEVRTGDWNTLGPDASSIRTTVFVEEQRVPLDMEWDEADATAVHAVAYNRLGMPLATGRLLQEGTGVAKVGRMAVARALRGTGVGAAVLRALEGQAAARGDAVVVLHAQRSAEGFYRRLGYGIDGEPFEEVGIAHITMRRSLRG